MSALGNQTMINDTKSFYLRASSGDSGSVPSPFSVVDETGPLRGSRLTITNADNITTLTNVDASGNATSTVGLGVNTVLLVSPSPPIEGYNVACSTSNTRVTQPLVVQSGSVPGIVMSNSLTGTGVIRNNNTGLPANNGIALNSFGVVSINGGQLACDSIGQTSIGVANSGPPQIFFNDGSNMSFRGAGYVSEASVSRPSSNTLQLNGQSQVVTTISGSPIVQSTSLGTSFTGNVSMSTPGADLTMNNGDLQFMANIQLNNGGQIGGVGTLNMINGAGQSSGTINGLSNMNTAGLQNITVTGYNPSGPTPVITLGANGSLTNSNALGDSFINRVTHTLGSTGNASYGGIRTDYAASPGNTLVKAYSGAGVWIFSARSQTNPAGWSFTMRLFNQSNAIDLLSVGTPPSWSFTNIADFTFEAYLAGASETFDVTATRLGAW